MPPLKLEEATAGTLFLETEFRIEDGRVHYRLKNVNANGRKTVWRYHAYDSYTPAWQKKSTLVATLKKVDAMASDRMEKWASAVDKLRELEELGYPVRVRREACGVVAAECGGGDVVASGGHTDGIGRLSDMRASRERQAAWRQDDNDRRTRRCDVAGQTEGRRDGCKHTRTHTTHTGEKKTARALRTWMITLPYLGDG